MKRLIYIIAIIFATGLSSTVHAVTDKEMEYTVPWLRRHISDMPTMAPAISTK